MKKLVYILAVVEGALVMCFELLVARLVSPHFGGSLYVLTSILGITMLSLLIGYFIGGRIVEKNIKNLSPTFLIIASGFLIALPFVAPILIQLFLKLGLISGSVTSVFFLLGIPLILLGAISPQLIQQLNNIKTKAGTAAGNIYSISTLGGVIITFILGLYMIPEMGVKSSSLTLGFSSLLIGLFLFYKFKPLNIKNNLLLICFSFVGLFSISNAQNTQNENFNVNILESSEGLLGKLEVKDFTNDYRALSNNHTDQSIIHVPSGESIFHYTHIVATLTSLLPPNERNTALIIGLAGGSLIKELNHLKYKKITAVDVDGRTKDFADKYFNLSSEFYIFVEDDGRHYLSQSDELYDIIILDVSSSEQQPYHLYTKEAFEIYYNKLSDNGLLILNILDYTDNRHVQITNKIGNSMISVGFEARLLKDFYPPNSLTPEKMEYYAHEKILVGTKKNKLDNIYSDMNELKPCCFKYNFNHGLKNNISQMCYFKNVVDGTIYTDDQPLMEIESYERSQILRTRFFNNNNY